MKYIRLYENYQDIESICQQYEILNYTINENLSIDVYGDIHINERNLFEIPIKFGRIYGNFNIIDNNLYSLINSPYRVDGYFYCGYNKLSSIKYCSSYVGNSLDISYNNLYIIDYNGHVRNNIYCHNNFVSEIVSIFKKDAKLYLEYLEIYNFQKDRNIYKTRFTEALTDLGISTLPVFDNYSYI